jgi:hypothetical protein
MRFFRKARKGQAAVEAMYAIPVMLLVFAIGCQLWNITYNAQYAHVKARSKMMESANHKPCEVSQDGRVQKLNRFQDTASATTDEHSYYGGRFIPTARNRTMKAKAVIKCNVN